jgi:hypothetical protein
VSNLQPAPRHVTHSRIWFETRHHQDKSRERALLVDGQPGREIGWQLLCDSLV